MRIRKQLSLLAACAAVTAAGISCYPGEDVPDFPREDPGPGGTEYVFSTVFKPGDDGYAFYRIPAMVVCADGTLLTFAEGRVNSVEDTGDIDIVLKRSEDGGKTWGDLIVVKNDGENRCHNPVPVALPSGRVMLLYCWNLGADAPDRKVYTRFSDDSGRTWGAETDITSQILEPGDYMYGAGPCHGIVKSYAPDAGRIVIPGRCKTTSATSSSYGRPAHVIYSDDQGATWHKGGTTDFANGNECTVAELGNGALVLNMRNTNTSNYYRYDARSVDGGESFLPSRQTTLVEPVTGCQGSLLRYGVDAATGKTTLLFSNPNHTSSRRHGSIKASFDDGDTWTKMFQFVSSSGDDMYTSYSDLALVGGDVGVVYEAGYKNSRGILFRTVKFSDIKNPATVN